MSMCGGGDPVIKLLLTFNPNRLCLHCVSVCSTQAQSWGQSMEVLPGVGGGWEEGVVRELSKTVLAMLLRCW